MPNLYALSVYRGLLEQPVTAALARFCAAAPHERACAEGALLHLLAQRGQPGDPAGAVLAELLADDNAYTRALAAGDTPSLPLATLAALAARDLALLEAATAAFSGGLPFPAAPWTPPDLPTYHAAHGCGIFAAHHAFLWREGDLRPVACPDPIRLEQLSGYETQRAAALRNTESFLAGREANNLLLYGDRGTGKSSTVKALLNAFAPRGLRMIELPKEALRDLPALSARLAALPMRFILFVDDLSFSADDEQFSALKAVLEGGLSACPPNVLLYATSNRRHLLRETFSGRTGDEVHRADTAQESASLSDRFGLALTFLLPDKAHFLAIAGHIAADRGLRLPPEVFHALAERRALERGARSPRFLKQLVVELLAEQEAAP